MGNILNITEFNCCKNPSIKKEINDKDSKIQELEIKIKKEINDKENKIEELEIKIEKLEKLKEPNEILEDLYDYSKKNDIVLIPLVKRYNLENLYPIEDEVEKWNIFIVGNDKTYIQAKAPDFSKNIKEDEMLNTKGKSYMEERIYNFLDKIWDKTLKGQQIQIFVYTFRTLYLLNSYGLRNENNEIIGAICFMRDAGLVDKAVFDINNNNPDDNFNFVDAFTKKRYNEKRYNEELENNKYLNPKDLIGKEPKELIGKEEVNN